MLNPEDRRAIEGLFDRLKDVEARGGERDADAETLIQRNISVQPGAPYYLAQTVLVQEHALTVAEQRIAELEQQVAERPAGGLLGGLFGGGRAPATQRQEYGQQRSSGQQANGQDAYGQQNAPARGPWGRDDSQDRGNGLNQPYGGGRGGGFLAGAAQTAMGVAGGVLLGNAIGGMFSGGEAHAAEPAQDAGNDAGQDAGQDAGHDTGSDFGGDAGDGGGFDFGGDF